MMVRAGWSTEYARDKYDVELDETDLARILGDAGIPAEAQSSLKLREAHTLLYCSAEIIAREALVRCEPKLKERLLAEAAKLAAERNALLTSLRDRFA